MKGKLFLYDHLRSKPEMTHRTVNPIISRPLLIKTIRMSYHALKSVLRKVENVTGHSKKSRLIRVGQPNRKETLIFVSDRTRKSFEAFRIILFLFLFYF